MHNICLAISTMTMMVMVMVMAALVLGVLSVWSEWWCLWTAQFFNRRQHSNICFVDFAIQLKKRQHSTDILFSFHCLFKSILQYDSAIDLAYRSIQHLFTIFTRNKGKQRKRNGKSNIQKVGTNIFCIFLYSTFILKKKQRKRKYFDSSRCQPTGGVKWRRMKKKNWNK